MSEDHQPNLEGVAQQAALGLLHPAVRAWFEESVGRPTPAQSMGWPSIAAGQNTLILAPTGSGKTLAAFLACLNQLYVEGEAGRDLSGIQVLYVSPLKALNNDIHRNLELPLRGIARTARRLGFDLPELTSAVRTGDTPAQARRAMLKKPPHILITTPESLYLILTSGQARRMLTTVRWVIVDEIHAMAGTKRGVHLALSLERVEDLARKPVRIGLSATQRPLEEIARFLGGLDPEGGEPRPVNIIDAGRRKDLDLKVTLTVDDLRVLPEGSIWPTVYPHLYEWIKAHRSTLVFVNNRRLAERLALKLNELAAAEVARTHHGSMSRAAREEVERDLKEGRLPCLVATSSLELGIDVGFIDLVVQVESPKSVSRGLQRVGRAGHLVGASAKGRVIPKQRSDLLEAAAIAREMLRGEIETTRVPRGCLDVLAQQIVAMAAVDEWPVDDLFRLIRRAYPYRELSRQRFEAVLEMLGGRDPAGELAEMKPRITWDKENGVVRGREGGQLLAIRGGGTIPDRGLFPVYLQGTRVRLGELDEEMVFESRLGEVFWLGSSPWRIESIERDRVFVSEAPGREAKIPFWKGEGLGRPYELGRQVGRFVREAEERLGAGLEAVTTWLENETACEPRAAANLAEYLIDQRAAAGLPSDRRIIVERFKDEVGDPRVIVHTPFGGPVHAAWSMAILRRLRQKHGLVVDCVYGDDGMLFRLIHSVGEGAAGFPPGFPPGFPLEGVNSANAEDLILHDLAGSALFGTSFRHAAARALVLTKGAAGERTPMWLQRLRAGDLLQAARRHADYPVTVEAYREVLEDVLHVGDLVDVLRSIESGQVAVETRETAVPSPFAANLLFRFIGVNMYGDDTPKAERRSQMLAVNREVLREALGSSGLRELLEPRAIADTVDWLQRRAEGRRARTADEVHDLLRHVGDLSLDELAERVEGTTPAADLIKQLVDARRAVAIEFPSGTATPGPAALPGSAAETAVRFVTAEDAPLYRDALGGAASARETVVRRYARTHGPFRPSEIQARYGFDPAWVREALAVLQAEGEVVAGEFTPGIEGREWCDADVLQQMHRRTLGILRHQMEPIAPRAFQRFLMARLLPPVGPVGSTGSVGSFGSTGPERLKEVLSRLRGLALPVDAWERDVLPARIPGYQPIWLDGLLAAGEFAWVAGRGGRVAFFPVGSICPPAASGTEESEPTREAESGQVDAAVLRVLEDRGASFAGAIAASAGLPVGAVVDSLLRLVGAGKVSNDTFAPARLLAAPARRKAQAGTTGRWWPVRPSGEAAAFWATALLDRYGVAARELMVAEGDPAPWSDVIAVLKREEILGRVRQGYFVNGLSGPQFAWPDAVERLREESPEQSAGEPTAAAAPAGEPAPLRMLSALDPAIAPGACPVSRVSGNYIVFSGARPVLAVENFGKRLASVVWEPDAAPDHTLLAAAVKHMATTFLRGSERGRDRRLKVAVESWDDAPVASSEAAKILRDLGGTPQGNAIIIWASSLP
ncbi:MAG: DNA glycosylase AlkZ-like family protein [Bacillota bacterium]